MSTKETNVNNKAQEYKKRQAKVAGAQADMNANKLDGQQRMITGIAMKVYELETKLNRLTQRLSGAEATARYADYRSSALTTLLQNSGTYSEAAVLNEIEVLQVKDFEANSEVDDQRNNLEVFNGAAETGLQAIVSLKFFKDGSELHTERVVRSKMELGKNEILPGVDEAVTGLTPGQTKRIAIDLQGKTDEMEITLLGLRKQRPVAETAVDDEQSAEQQ
jgi:hypothetical protein